MSSSGVPMPTNPEVHTVSPSRITATASSGETILCVSMLRGRVVVVLGQPVRDARAQQPLRIAAHEHAHMAAGQRELLIVLAPDAEPQGLGGRSSLGPVVLISYLRLQPSCRHVTMGFASPIWEVTGAEVVKGSQGWPHSSMERASAFEAEGCRVEPCR